MCRRITCSTCAKPGWAGCGAHIEQVLGDVALTDRCQCSAEDKTAARKARSANGGKTGSFLSRLLGR